AVVAGWLMATLGTSRQVHSDTDEGQRLTAKKDKQFLAQTQHNGALVNRVIRLEHRVKILSKRLKALQEKSQGIPSDTKGVVAHVSLGANGGPSPEDVSRSFGILLDDLDSPARRAVNQIVRDEFENIRSEWRAFRAARHEARDDELLEELANQVDLDSDERSRIYELLQKERKEMAKVRRDARRDFDIRGGRQRSKELRLQTDSIVRDLLGGERFDTWRSLRKPQRGGR
ncbi:MAG: hypothetical protein ACPGQS_14515, partial [Bradymonadia bacterium]